MDSKNTNSKPSRGRTTLCLFLAAVAALVFVYRALFYKEPAQNSDSLVTTNNVSQTFLSSEDLLTLLVL